MAEDKRINVETERFRQGQEKSIKTIHLSQPRLSCVVEGVHITKSSFQVKGNKNLHCTPYKIPALDWREFTVETAAPVFGPSLTKESGNVVQDGGQRHPSQGVPGLRWATTQGAVRREWGQ